MNTKLLLEVKAAILAEPLKFDMNSWANRNELSPCGTTACIAGHAYAIAEKCKTLRDVLDADSSNVFRVENVARKVIGIDTVHILFHVRYWPSRFERAYRNAKTSKGRASVAARRIDHFIATKGVE